MDHGNSARNLNGLYAALFTPFTESGEIDFDRLDSLLHFQLCQGLSGFFVSGTTGEGLLLEFDERVELIRFVVDRCRNADQYKGFEATVIAHVGHPSSDTAARLARESANAGADWIGSIGPVFYGNTFEGTKRHYECIAEATDLPFMIYSLQSTIIPDRDQELFSIANVAGIKYTGSDFFALQQLASRIERDVALISGMDELFVAGQAMGCQAGIGSTYNFMPGKFAQMQASCRDNDFHQAMKIQQEVNRVIDYFVRFENWTYRKAFMRYIGLDCGSCRQPFGPISQDQYESFAKGLDALQVLERDSASSFAVQ